MEKPADWRVFPGYPPQEIFVRRDMPTMPISAVPNSKKAAGTDTGETVQQGLTG
jgi:hypothetical protein